MLRACDSEEKMMALRIAESVLSRDGALTELAKFRHWLAELEKTAHMDVDVLPLDDLAGWTSSPITGNISHDSGKFFTVEGLDVRMPDGVVPNWSQPIISQPEVGVLGILVKEFDGVLHCLMQAKVEPGNHNGPQLSPTVQATRSNYTQVHRGRAVPYLEYFRGPSRYRVIADVRQSEQGSWFNRKRNRNIIVETDEDVPLLDGFCWLTLGQVHRLLAVDDLVNMDSRTVLSCFPFAGTGLLRAFASHRGGFHGSLIRSYSEDERSLHSMDDVRSWITEVRAGVDVRTRVIALNELRFWRRTEERISHESGLFFDVIGVGVRAGGREVAEWNQPMIAPVGTGLVALLVATVNEVLHVLVHARVEPGYVDVVELAPTVQCTPENYAWLPDTARPRFLDDVQRLRPDQVLFDTTLSEEGGRFYHARNRYLIAEVDIGPEFEAPDFRWMTLRQFVELLRHSYYLNVQARSLVACLHSLSATQTAP
jgi:dTDP-4-dehydro-6-deoxy-alpha-D-glucopyranose 2,3-dehydratase